MDEFAASHSDDTHSQPAHAVTHRAPARSNERGNILVLVLVLMVAGGVLTVAVLNNLLGEIQGALSYRHAVQALGAAEAGVHYATAKINDTNNYSGEINRVVTHPSQGQVGAFDVAVRCIDGTVPGNPDPCATAPLPYVRVITSTGFAPTKTLALGRRTVIAYIRQGLLTTLDYAVCGQDSVTLDRDSDTYGNVGSDGNISLLGPPTTLARIHAFGPQAGNATAGGTVTCSGSCGSPYFQVEGTTTSGAGTVCPVLPTFSCNPGTTDALNQSTLTISVSNGNTSLRDVTMASNSVLTFQTNSANEILTVQMNTLIIAQNSRVRINGPGKVELYLAGRTEVSQGTLWGVDPSDGSLEPGRFVLRSCATDVGADYAVEFHQTGQINGIILAPNGRVQLDRAALSRGAIQSRNVQFDLLTQFSFDTTGFAISSGPFNTLTSWREQP